MLGAALERLIALPEWLDSWSESRRDRAGLKDMTSQLIGRSCNAAHDATPHRLHDRPPPRHAAGPCVPGDTPAEIGGRKGVTEHYVMAPRENEPLYLQQRTMLREITEALFAAGPAELEPTFVSDWHEAEDDAARLRVVIDQVASLTDHSAQAWHERL